MKFLHFLSKFREIQIKRIYLLYILYSLACISVITQIILKAYELASFLGIALFGALIIRKVTLLLRKKMGDESEKKTTDWNALRRQLTQILSESRILLDTAVELRSDEASKVIFSGNQVNGDFFEENEELIKDTRKIGIDGLLCLIFLIQQQPSVVSVKAMQKSLKIPIASAYRQLQKLSEYKLVITYYHPDKPSKALYKITDDGSSLVIRLYELIGGSMIPALDEKRNQIEAET